MKDKFNTFFNKWNGKPCEVNDPSNLNQCMDLAYAWLDELGVTRDAIRHLYASEVYVKPNDATVKYFEMIPNTAMAVPHIGDLVVFNGYVYINGVKVNVGHISVSNGEGDINTFKTFDQNFLTTKNKCGIITHAYTDVLGFLRFREPVQAPITDQTKLPIIDENGNEMEVQAVRSRLADLTKIKNNNEVEIINLKLSITSLNKKITELENKPEPICPDLSKLAQVVYSRWTWIGKTNGWKKRLSELKQLLG